MVVKLKVEYNIIYNIFIKLYKLKCMINNLFLILNLKIYSFMSLTLKYKTLDLSKF